MFAEMVFSESVLSASEDDLAVIRVTAKDLLLAGAVFLELYCPHVGYTRILSAVNDALFLFSSSIKALVP